MKILGQHRTLIWFFAKLLGVYIAWFLLYDLWLLQDGRLDAWLSERIAIAGTHVLSLLGHEASRHGTIFWIEGTQGIEVVPGCNALALFGLFFGFVFAYPGLPKRRVVFVLVGIVLLHLVNISRITALALVQYYHPASFDAVHFLGGKGFFYLVVLLLWIVWIHFGNVPMKQQKVLKTTSLMPG